MLVMRKSNIEQKPSCARCARIGAGCSQSSRLRSGGCAVAAAARKRAACSVAPAPLYERRQTDRQTDNRQTNSSNLNPLCICSSLVCPLPPFVGGAAGLCPVGGRLCPVGGASGSVVASLLHLPRRSRLLGCASRSPLAKRLRGHLVACAAGACVSAPAGLFVPGLSRACSPFYVEGVLI